MKLKLLAFSYCILISGLAFSQDDTLRTNTGELFIGTVINLSESRLTFKSKSGKKNFTIDWKTVTQINTYHFLRVVSMDGEVHEGVLRDTLDGDPYLIFYVKGEARQIRYEEIISMQKIESSFKEKLDLLINLGYSFNKGTNTTQLSVRSAAGYNSEKWSFDADYNEFLTIIDTIQNNRLDASASSRYLFKNNWFTSTSANWFSSDEQELELRTTILVGGGKFLLYDQIKTLQLGTGIALNEERFSTENSPVQESYEVYLLGKYRLFDHKYYGINTSFIGYASLTEDDRYRASYSLDFSWDIGDNFDLIWGYSLNFDSNPPNRAQQTDYVISLTVGWSL